MIITADSGSTKTEWAVSATETFTTKGINPFYMNEDEIVNLLNTEFAFDKSKITSVYFYGAGVIPEKRAVVTQALKRFFGIDDIHADTDLTGAARGLCKQSAGIVAIMGTGSNSCYYDGNAIIKNIPPLGYILGDEGSGADIAKHFISSLFKGLLPENICSDFTETYNTTLPEVLENVYRKPFANRYLAGFMPFVYKHRQNPEIAKIVKARFEAFFERNILQYKQSADLYFTGSVAWFFKDILEQTAQRYGLKIASVEKSPVKGIYKYHSSL